MGFYHGIILGEVLVPGCCLPLVPHRNKSVWLHAQCLKSSSSSDHQVYLSGPHENMIPEQPHLGPQPLFKLSPGPCPCPVSELCCSLGAVCDSWAVAVSSSLKGHNFFWANYEALIVDNEFWIIWHFIPALRGLFWHRQDLWTPCCDCHPAFADKWHF